MIRGVVFDLDGVLADTEPVYQAMRTEYLSRFGVTLTPPSRLQQTMKRRSCKWLRKN